MIKSLQRFCFLLLPAVLFSCSSTREMAVTQAKPSIHQLSIELNHPTVTASEAASGYADQATAEAKVTVAPSQVNGIEKVSDAVTKQKEFSFADQTENLLAKKALAKAEKTGSSGFMQRMVLKKLMKQQKDALSKASPQDSESAKALDGNLKLALIFLVVGLILSLLPVLDILAVVCYIIALVFFILWIASL